MTMANRQEQVMMHLYAHRRGGTEYEMPFATTQDGIADAVGICRSQASAVLKRLEEKDLVYHLARHAYREGCPNRRLRRCYRLNPLGKMRACELLEESGEVA